MKQAPFTLVHRKIRPREVQSWAMVAQPVGHLDPRVTQTTGVIKLQGITQTTGGHSAIGVTQTVEVTLLTGITQILRAT